jgi:hypothetical protein
VNNILRNCGNLRGVGVNFKMEILGNEGNRAICSRELLMRNREMSVKLKILVKM